MRKAVAVLAALLFLCGSLAPAPSLAKAKPRSPQPARASVVVRLVHVTRTGSKYHSAGCRYLSQSDSTVTLADAEARGLTPCSVCGGVPTVYRTAAATPAPARARAASPPVKRAPVAVTVYATRTGSKYHAAGCRYLSRSCIPMTKDAAIRMGLTPCSVCGDG
ncbi:MAG TPA: hypothetical protein VGN26_12540 [Armatimonadota bacterium]|jgi:hypothetical protein